MKILVINAGSSSIKLQLLEEKKHNLMRIYKGMINALNLKKSFIEETYNNTTQSSENKKLNHEQALKKLVERIKYIGLIKNMKDIAALGHRVVHGGEEYIQITRLNEKVKNRIRYYGKFAPLHNPANLTAIEACEKLFPKTPQFAVFDTAFHQSIPKKAFLYALPYAYYKNMGIRKLGFHGTSHRYVAEETIKYLKKKNSKIITCHLGNGSSITAIQNGKSIDTSMGFTPLEGIPMGTRSGDIDPAIIFHIMKFCKISAEETENILNKASGLLGISGISSDVRKLWALAQKKNQKALLALEILSYRIAKYIGAYTSALNGLDAITFTGGIGEHAYYLRQQICDHLSYLGLTLHPQKNKTNALHINTPKSKIKVFIIPTDEEKQIAKEIHQFLKKQPAKPTHY